MHLGTRREGPSPWKQASTCPISQSKQWQTSDVSRQSQSQLTRTNTVPRSERCASPPLTTKGPLMRRHSTSTGKRRHVKDTSCQTELDVLALGKGFWYLNRRDIDSCHGKEWTAQNGRGSEPSLKELQPLDTPGSSPKSRSRGSRSVVASHSRLSTDTAFSETSLVESVDSSGEGGSCFSADIESDSDFVTDEDAWENPKQPLLGRRRTKTGRIPVRHESSGMSEEPEETENGNVCKGSSVAPRGDGNGNRQRRIRAEDREHPNFQRTSEEEESTIESSSSGSESDSPSGDEENSSSCPSEHTTTEEECVQCLQEPVITVDDRALSPEVVVINDEVDEHSVPVTEGPSVINETISPSYLRPPLELIGGDIMHTGKPIPDDLEEGSDIGGCRRLSEEEFVATLNIHDASRTGDLHVVKLLLKRDSKRMETVDPRGWTPIHLAAANGHADVVKFLAIEGAHLAALDPSGYNAIHIAAMNGHHECIDVLLKMGVDVDTVTTDGFTPLHLATMNNYVDCCRTLLKWGASLEKKDALGRNVHDMIEEYSLDEVQSFLETFQQDLECLRILEATANKR